MLSLRRLAASILCVGLGVACSRGVERYYADGVCRAAGREAWISRAETGEWTYWYPSGEPRESGRLSEGTRIGTWTQWWPNGQLRSRGERRFDARARGSVRVGPWTTWHANGVRESAGAYARGEREGHWDFTLDDGSLDGDRTGEYHRDAKIDG